MIQKLILQRFILDHLIGRAGNAHAMIDMDENDGCLFAGMGGFHERFEEVGSVVDGAAVVYGD